MVSVCDPWTDTCEQKVPLGKPLRGYLVCFHMLLALPVPRSPGQCTTPEARRDLAKPERARPRTRREFRAPKAGQWNVDPFSNFAEEVGPLSDFLAETCKLTSFGYEGITKRSSDCALRW